MGLDMYLVGKIHLSTAEFYSESARTTAQTIIDTTGVAPDKDSPFMDVSVNVGYWRKANAIHNWFVTNVQGGEDDCGHHMVGRDQLVALRDLCQKVLDESKTAPGQLKAGTTFHGDGKVEHHMVAGEVITNSEVAASLLPTTGGFFFGDTEYNDYYMQDLKDTIGIVDKAVKLIDEKKIDYCEYHASW
jgi:hypothetical protein